MAGSQLTRLPVLSSCEKRLPVGFVEIWGSRLSTANAYRQDPVIATIGRSPRLWDRFLLRYDRRLGEVFDRSEQVRLRTDLIRALDAVL